MNSTILWIGLVLIVLYFVLSPLWAAGKIAPQEAAEWIAAGKAVLVDVREISEYAGGVAQPASRLPLSDLQGSRTRWKDFLAKNKDKTIILYCASGMRSAHAARILEKEGFTTRNCGGYGTWKRAGLPSRQS